MSQKATSTYDDKFVAFVDILGFKNMVAESEKVGDQGLEDILKLLEHLKGPETRERFAKHGPTLCPQSKYIKRNLDYRVTQISDCAIISAEVSPAGVINLVEHCWMIVLNLLFKGVLVRGYVTRGSVFHSNTQVLGSAYQEAYSKESTVSAFQRNAEERGTPYVEIDQEVVDYINQQTDDCVTELFRRFTRKDGEASVIYPFQRLAPNFIAASADPNFHFDLEKQLQSNKDLRKVINTALDTLRSNKPSDNEKAAQKYEHYEKALLEQIEVCLQVDQDLMRLI